VLRCRNSEKNDEGGPSNCWCYLFSSEALWCWCVTQVTALFKEAGISNICVQVEKRTYFQHLQGLGVSSDRLHAMTHGFKTLGSRDFASFISDLWLVFACCWNPFSSSFRCTLLTHKLAESAPFYFKNMFVKPFKWKFVISQICKLKWIYTRTKSLIFLELYLYSVWCVCACVCVCSYAPVVARTNSS